MWVSDLHTSLYKTKKSLKSRYYSFSTYYKCLFNDYHPVDFLIIGASRSGTTWLHGQLNKHSEFFLPTFANANDVTEVRFFSNRISKGVSWYHDLYRNKEGKIWGDKSPSYYTQPNHRIKLIKSYNLSIKLVFLLRDPVQRAWSDSIMNFKRFNGIDYNNNEEIYKNYLFSDNILRRGRYAFQLKRWLKHFDPDQIYIGIFDQFHSNPQEYFRKILSFLGGGESRELVDASDKVNTNPQSDIPDEIATRLADYFEEDIISLDSEFGINVRHWLDRYQKISSF